MYLAGFGNYHYSEAIEGALPSDQNSPQQCAYGLYAEQLSGSAFTRPRHLNLRSWLYRILPSVVRSNYVPYKTTLAIQHALDQPPNPFRWKPFPLSSKPNDFIDGLFHIAGNKSLNAFIYQCHQSMGKRYFCNHDGELLFVPYLGELILFTEFGKLSIEPGKIAVIPRGVTFQVQVSSLAAGYLCENRKNPLTLPQLGPLGANALANPRHFHYPTASYEHTQQETVLISKYQHKLWSAKCNDSPLNVVAWHGNYAPYCYDLSLFNTMNTVSFDHADPSIFTVLTSESNTPGVANLDFVIFPPRWMVAEHTFRPPYFHRNIMSEFMGLIQGEYDAKKEGFVPGGISIHNAMIGHGPDEATYRSAVQQALKPERYENTLAFMFEAKNPWLMNERALRHPAREVNYSDCWQQLPINFKI